MNILKKIAVRIIPVGVLTFLIVAAIAYQRGVYDITFIERPAADTAASTETIPSDTTSESASTETTAADTTTAPDTEDTTAPVELTGQTALISEFLSTLRTTGEVTASGYSVTDARYENHMWLTRLETDTSLRNTFTLRTKTVSVPERIPDEYSGYTTQLNEVSVDRPLVEVYMDYILVDNGSTVDLLKSDGTVLIRGFDIDQYKPAYTRDKNDNALFKTEEKSQSRYGVTITRYYMLDESGKLIVSDYNDAADNRGLYINYPTYFGKSDNSYQTRYSGGYYGYISASGSGTQYRYTEAYNFSEGLAAVCDADGKLTYVNNYFSRRIGGTKQYINLSERRVYADYYTPDSHGIESLGFYYFENGLVRIRKREIDGFHLDYYGAEHAVSDTDIVIRSDGTEFPVPSDYTVIAYSNGVLLLEKDGLYGFMDYTGKWIAQPIYTAAEPFNEGLAVVELDGRAGMIDTSGEFVIPLIFDYVGSVSGGVVAAYDDELGWTLFNKMER